MYSITCKDLSISYDQKVVVENLNFQLNQGDFLCIFGDNGAGKSTLIQAILKLKQVDSDMIENQFKQNQIGYLAQKTVIKHDFPASVLEVVSSGVLAQKSFLPFYTKKQKEIIQNNLKRLSIEDIQHKSIQELSGGQLQRVLLARALCAGQKLLILDEPTAGLDPLVSQELYQLCKQLNQEGLSIIMVSHAIEDAMRYANKILHIKQKQLFFGTTQEYRETELAKQYLGVKSCNI